MIETRHMIEDFPRVVQGVFIEENDDVLEGGYFEW